MSEGTDAGSNGAGNGAGREQWPTSGVGYRPSTTVRRESAPKRTVATIGFLLDASRRRRSGRMVLWGLVVAMALAGVGLLAYPVATDVWAHSIQGNLNKKFSHISSADGLALFRSKDIKEGDALTRLIIPRLHVSVMVVEGITGNALRAGAGHYPNTSLPGDVSGNIAIAGHRTGFGEPFRHLELMRQGDRVELVTPFGRYIYQVIGPFDGHSNPWITGPTDWSVTSPTPEPSLTLTTCDPPHTSKNRLIVRARLISTQAT